MQQIVIAVTMPADFADRLCPCQCRIRISLDERFAAEQKISSHVFGAIRVIRWQSECTNLVRGIDNRTERLRPELEETAVEQVACPNAR